MAAFSPINLKAPFIWHGGDYNPEQWQPDTWDDDVELMQRCHFNVATVGVFSWVSLQPAETTFTFEWLDTIVDK
ncbi:MAG: GH42, partial [uncultured Chloroflexia bacterium]